MDWNANRPLIWQNIPTPFLVWLAWLTLHCGAALFLRFGTELDAPSDSPAASCSAVASGTVPVGGTSGLPASCAWTDGAGGVVVTVGIDFPGRCTSADSATRDTPARVTNDKFVVDMPAQWEEKGQQA